MAVFVSKIASDVFDQVVELTPDDFHPGCFDYRLERYESDNGEIVHCHISVDTLGVDVHTRFASPQFAPWGANECSGKWNHYIWPRHHTTAESYREAVEAELRAVLPKVKPNSATRQNRPDIRDYWAAQRAEFAEVCADRSSSLLPESI